MSQLSNLSKTSGVGIEEATDSALFRPQLAIECMGSCAYREKTGWNVATI